jgi:hypothetical protein
MVSRNAFDATDPFIGRIKSTTIPPPRTVDTLKCCLAYFESLSDPNNQRTELYLTASSDSPIQNSNLLLVGEDLGSSPQSAVAFVLRQDLSDVEKASLGSVRVPNDFRVSPRRNSRKSAKLRHPNHP